MSIFGKMDLNEKATVRFETMPSFQEQVDWGFFENYKVLENGKYKKLYYFLMILGYSRMRYIEFVTDMRTATLIKCHINLRRIEKDCLISYARNKYSVPSEYVGRDVTVIVLDHMLAAYFEGKQIVLHKLCLQ